MWFVYLITLPMGIPHHIPWFTVSIGCGWVIRIISRNYALQETFLILAPDSVTAAIAGIAAPGVILVVPIAISGFALPVIVRMQVIIELEDPVPVPILGHGYQKIVLVRYGFQTVLHAVVIRQFHLPVPVRLNFLLHDPVSIRIVGVFHVLIMIPSRPHPR